MSDYADWQGIDRGHEESWDRPIWMGVLLALEKCGGSAEFLSKDSAFYKELKEIVPDFPGYSIDKNGVWRSDFRDAREPWVGTGVISFDDSQMTLTEKGRDFLLGRITYDKIICDTVMEFSENGENPFEILAKTFLELPMNQGLSIDDVAKIMRHYRPDIDHDLESVLSGNVEEKYDQRRLRHILRLLTFTGGIVYDRKRYYIASRKILKDSLERKSNCKFSPEQVKGRFVQWLADDKNCHGKPTFKKQMANIIECWLDQRLPNENIGNLYRFLDADEFGKEKNRIFNLPQFKKVNEKGGNGRPMTALNHYENFLKGLNFSQHSDMQIFSAQSKEIPLEQVIYYGVPGSGKSFEVNKAIDYELTKHLVADKEYHKIRCVFHPEYSNADFVGQIYPYIKPDNEGVEYRFKPGPFAEAVRRAYRFPDEPFFLIIEEINRGNAAAIFGEMFQLLDRIKKGNPQDKSTENHYKCGWSSYGVNNFDVNAYIRQEKDCYEPEEKIKYDNPYERPRNDCDWHNTKDGSDIVENNKLHFSVNTAIRLPPNLSIYATMNTSDQNVFTLDNAFQRRFKFRMIDNDLNDVAQYDIVIGKNDGNETSTEVRWGSFRNWINKKILSQKGALSKSEDKCLGGWFVSTDAIKVDENKKVVEYENISREDFAEKVLKYLWYDVFRRNSATEVFNEPETTGDKDVVSFARLAKEFKSKDNVGFDAFKKIFKDIEKDKEFLTKTYAESKVNP